MPTSGFCVFIFFTRIGDRELIGQRWKKSKNNSVNYNYE